MIKIPLDKIKLCQITDALKECSAEDKKKLEAVLKRKKQLKIIDGGIKELGNLEEPNFKTKI